MRNLNFGTGQNTAFNSIGSTATESIKKDENKKPQVSVKVDVNINV